MRRRSEAREFLIFGDRVAFLDEQVSDAGALLIDADLRFAARYDEASDAHHVGEAGIGGLGHDHQRLARRVLLFRVRTELEPVIAEGHNGNESHTERRFEVFGEFHRRINPEPNSCEAGRFELPVGFLRPKKTCVPQGGARHIL